MVMLDLINLIVRSIVEFFNNLFRLIGIKKQRDANMNLTIFVKLDGGLAIPITLQPNWTINNIKKAVSSKAHVSSDDIRIIFAGKELDNDTKIQECDVGQHTVIHAVKNRTKSSFVTDSNISCPLSQFVLRLNLTEEEQKLLPEEQKTHFFVYCSSPCKNICPGKLRVRCSLCKQGTLTVSRDPSSWDDVLISNSIPGVCHADGCSGNVAEFYFKCAAHVAAEDDSSVALYLIKNNYKRVPCLACTEVSPVVLVFPCVDGHVICLECFRVYCISRLNERRFIQDDSLGYTLPCAAGCPDSLIKEVHHFHLLGDEQYSRYQRFGAEECLLQAGGVLCPYPGCGAGILPDSGCQRVICSKQNGHGCGYVFCRNCLQGYHIGPCEESNTETGIENFAYSIDDARAEHSRWDEESKKTIQVLTKPCPKCRTPTERDGGCMHMVCFRAQCGYHWCWICQSEWTRECMGNHWFG